MVKLVKNFRSEFYWKLIGDDESPKSADVGSQYEGDDSLPGARVVLEPLLVISADVQQHSFSHHREEHFEGSSSCRMGFIAKKKQIF